MISSKISLVDKLVKVGGDFRFNWIVRWNDVEGKLSYCYSLVVAGVSFSDFELGERALWVEERQ